MTPYASREAECAIIFHLAMSKKQAHIFSLLNEDDFTSQDTKAMFARLFKAYSEGNPLRGHSAVIEAVAPYAQQMGSQMACVETTCDCLVLATKKRETDALIITAQAGIDSFDATVQDLDKVGLEIAQTMSESRSVSSGEVEIKQMMESLFAEEKLAANGHTTHISTGIGIFDQYQSLEPGNLVILGARPSVGKTAMAISMAIGMARRSFNVGFICLEMTANEIRDRFISQMGQIPHHLVKDKRFDAFMPQFARAQEDFKAWAKADSMKFSLGNSDMNAMSVCELIRKWHRTHGTQVIFVDYLQRLEPINLRDPTVVQISRNVKKLKDIAKELGVVVVLLAQVNRQSEAHNTPTRPRLSNLKGSSAIEEEADVVWLMWRPEREIDADEETVWPMVMEEGKSKQILDEGKAAVFADKNRNGKTWKLRIDFIGETMTYDRVIGE